MSKLIAGLVASLFAVSVFAAPQAAAPAKKAKKSKKAKKAAASDAGATTPAPTAGK
jgi:hypothetical protein